MRSTETIYELYKMYDAINDAYYGGELPNSIIINLIQGVTRSKNIEGVFYADQYVKGEAEDIEDSIYEIGIAGEYLASGVVHAACTLAHEMVHLYCKINGIRDMNKMGTKHSKKFAKVCDKHGLICDEDPKYGWAMTTGSAAFVEFIESCGFDESVFEYWRNTIIPAPTIVSKKQFICPICQTKVSAKAETNIMCGDCNTYFDLWDMTDPDEPKILKDNNKGLAMTADGWYGREFLDL